MAEGRIEFKLVGDACRAIDTLTIAQMRTLIAEWRTVAARVDIPACTVFQRCADDLEQVVNLAVAARTGGRER